MIRLRRSIERGMRHRWLGPIFVVLLALLLALLYLHSVHDGQPGASLGELCIGITMVIGIVLLVRLRFQTPVQIVLVRLGRAPPVIRLKSQSIRLQRAAVSSPLRL